MSSASTPKPESAEPAWQLAHLFPPQGSWSEGYYLSFTETLNQLVELVDGVVEVLEVPTKSHQKIVQYLLRLVLEFLNDRGLGDAISAPYRIRLRKGCFREPDIAVYLKRNLMRFGERYGEGADLVMEVVSEDPASRHRDYEDKRKDYAEAEIPEYWIIDPLEGKMSVFFLVDADYQLLGEFRVGEEAESRLLDGFRVNVNKVMESGR